MPPREYHFWVYILSSRSRNLYVGITNSLIRRTASHRKGTGSSHTAHYAVHRLVYFEYFQYVRSAIAREKQLKHCTREQKIELIEKTNPTWEDLYPKPLHPPEPHKQIPCGNDSKKSNCKCRALEDVKLSWCQRLLQLPLLLLFFLSFPQGICCRSVHFFSKPIS